MLTLNVPRTDETVRKPAVETRPKATAAWLERLPFASPVDVARQLLEALYALNRHPLDANERDALLSLYRPVVANAARSLETLLSGDAVGGLSGLADVVLIAAALVVGLLVANVALPARKVL